MTVGERIKQTRKAAEMTMNQLAKKTGLCSASIYRYEEDKADPSLFAASCIADVLGVSLDYIAGRKPDLEISKIETMASEIKMLREKLDRIQQITEE